MIGCLILVTSGQLGGAYPSTMTLPTYSTPPAGTLDHIDLRADVQTIITIDHCLPDKHSMTTPTCQRFLKSGMQTLSSISHCMPENPIEVLSPSKFQLRLEREAGMETTGRAGHTDFGKGGGT